MENSLLKLNASKRAVLLMNKENMLMILSSRTVLTKINDYKVSEKCSLEITIRSEVVFKE